MPRTIYTASAAKLVTRIVADILDVAITFKQAVGNRNGKAVAVCAACSCGTPAFPHCRQWGNAATSNGIKEVTYPILFLSSSMPAVVAMHRGTGNNIIFTGDVGNAATTFRTNFTSGAANFLWIAIGYY